MKSVKNIENNFFSRCKEAVIISLLFWLFSPLVVCAKTNNGGSLLYKSYNGLVMTGYQGWFNTPDDGANKGWTHYDKRGVFAPNCSTIDMWPDVSELKRSYTTLFNHKDGAVARVFSSFDASTVDKHFDWMKQYGIDGIFLQRFVSEIKAPKSKSHCDKILNSAVASAKKHERALCIMYDLSGMNHNDVQLLLKDASELNDTYKLTRKGLNTYLHHNGKPLIAVWGVGFSDSRKYGLNEAEAIIDGLKKLGFSVLIGVPTHWRTLKRDTQPDKRLHSLIAKCDIIHPWFVGRFNIDTYPTFQRQIRADIDWCKSHNIDYVPTIFPGFSWENMNGKGSNFISREKGNFYWKQLYGAIAEGSSMLYVAMFDEVDEGTAIFKCLNQKNVPLNGQGRFLGIDDELQPDHYLWLTGLGKQMLLGKHPLVATQPVRESINKK